MLLAVECFFQKRPEIRDFIFFLQLSVHAFPLPGNNPIRIYFKTGSAQCFHEKILTSPHEWHFSFIGDKTDAAVSVLLEIFDGTDCHIVHILLDPMGFQHFIDMIDSHMRQRQNIAFPEFRVHLSVKNDSGNIPVDQTCRRLPVHAHMGKQQIVSVLLKHTVQPAENWFVDGTVAERTL